MRTYVGSNRFESLDIGIGCVPDWPKQLSKARPCVGFSGVVDSARLTVFCVLLLRPTPRSRMDTGTALRYMQTMAVIFRFDSQYGDHGTLYNTIVLICRARSGNMQPSPAAYDSRPLLVQRFRRKLVWVGRARSTL